MTTDWSRAPRLTTVEFLACWVALDLGDTPLVLALRPPGASAPERRRILAEAMTELRRRGLAGPDGPNAPLAALLRRLARPSYELDIRLAGGPEGMFVGLGAVTGEHGVVVTAAAGVLNLLPMDAACVPATLLELAGPVEPGQGRPVNIPAEVLDDACAATGDSNLWSLAEQLTARGVARIDAASLARMCTGIRSCGQLGATGRAEDGHRRAPWVVGFHRTDEGHFLQLRRPSTGGATTVTVAPLTTGRLLHQLRKLVASLPVA